MKSGFKQTFNWNKYQSEVTKQAPNSYLDFFIDPNFWGVNRLFILSFENKDNREVHKRYSLPKVKIKDYIVMIHGKDFFNQPVKSNMTTYDNIQKIAIGQEDDYKIGFLLDNNCFN